MRNYHHSVHAGNFADVLKHLVSTQILAYLTQKEAPLFYLETHSGSGGFSLLDSSTQKKRKYRNGIGKLWELEKPLPKALHSYISLVRSFNPGRKLERYPGSPWLAQTFLRDHDRACLFELHPETFQACKANFQQDKRFKIFNRDGFKNCIAQLPANTMQTYLLVDPPYEAPWEYQCAVETVIKAHAKIPDGTLALWYPVVERRKIHLMEKQFKQSGIGNIQLFELGIAGDTAKGMTSSGMIVINPPPKLKETLQAVLPFLAENLGETNAFYRIEQLNNV